MAGDEINLRHEFGVGHEMHFMTIAGHRAGTKIFAKLYDVRSREALAERHYYLAETDDDTKLVTLHGEMAPRVEGQERPAPRVFTIPDSHIFLELRIPAQSVAPQTRLSRARSAPAPEVGAPVIDADVVNDAFAAAGNNANNNAAALDPAVIAAVMNAVLERTVGQRLADMQQQMEDARAETRTDAVAGPDMPPPRVQLFIGKFQVLAIPTTDFDGNGFRESDASKWKLFGDFSCRRSMGVPHLYFSPPHLLEGDKSTVLLRLSKLVTDITSATEGLMQEMKSMNPTIEASRIGSFGGVSELTNSIDAYVTLLTYVARGWYPQSTVQWYPLLWSAVNVLACMASRAVGHHHGGHVVQLNFITMKKKGHFDPLTLTEQHADVPVTRRK